MTVLASGPVTGDVVTLAESRANARRYARKAFLAGVVMIALIVGVTGTIVADFEGDFTAYALVHADLPVGQPVDTQSEVEYQEIEVGQVASIGHALPDGAVEVTLHIIPGKLAQIPANVIAQVAPSSVFGTEAVILSASRPSSTHLQSGAVVPAAGDSTSLQGALSNLDTLLTGLHPAEIDTTLGALSTAFQGQGPAASDAIRIVNSYIDGLLPELPTFEQDIDLVTPVLNGLSASVPSLLDIATNSASVATTLTDEQALVASLLAKGTALTTAAKDLFSAAQTSLHDFLVDLAPLLVDVNGRPGVLPAMLDALRGLTESFIPVFTSTSIPAVNVAVTQYVNDPEEALLAGSDLPISQRQIAQIAHAAFLSLMDPPTYTAADCPRYGAEAGPNCPSSTTAAARSSAAGTKATRAASKAAAPPLPSAQADAPELTAAEQSAIAKLMKAIDGIPLAQPSTADLILGPLLQSLVP